ncbi:hypothetical protein M23134_06640 [Microscilla marina ATCC 23134]|uniref:Uncharacterized protein n=1 Tax=Microscilla marina ATCC 23134 TaxID=313606 RepID=A1ZW18_MICM2|nr:hypothetical protein M23134_06640 [Microscilla marina ATCC 23134]
MVDWQWHTLVFLMHLSGNIQGCLPLLGSFVAKSMFKVSQTAMLAL